MTTEHDEARLAEMIDSQRCLSTEELARHLLEQGVTLPPDPTEVVAEALCDAIWGAGKWGPTGPAPSRLLDALRDLFTPETLAELAAALKDDR